MDLNECFEKGLIRKVTPNKELIISLIEMADIKEITVKKAKIDKQNISVYVSISYDSLREILEAICISKGYKVLSHVCIGNLLKSILNDFDYNGFDRLRYIRNNINYYGVKVEFNQGKEVIDKIFIMKKRLTEKYLKDFVDNVS